jgi:hypothetical protein
MNGRENEKTDEHTHVYNLRGEGPSPRGRAVRGVTGALAACSGAYRTGAALLAVAGGGRASAPRGMNENPRKPLPTTLSWLTPKRLKSLRTAGLRLRKAPNSSVVSWFESSKSSAHPAGASQQSSLAIWAWSVWVRGVGCASALRHPGTWVRGACTAYTAP